jgi:hypothetical protein
LKIVSENRGADTGPHPDFRVSPFCPFNPFFRACRESCGGGRRDRRVW